MKVTIMGPDERTGGIGSYTHDLASKFGDSVEINLSTFPNGGMNILKYILSVTYSFRSDSEVIHIQHEYALFGPFSIISWLFFPLVYILSKIYKKKVVITLHEVLNPDLVGDYWIKSVYIYLINKLIAKSSDHIIFLSDTAEERFANHSVSYSVLSHGANLDVPKTSEIEAKKQFGYSAEQTLIVEPGYVVPRKGSHIMRDLASELDEYEFLLAGGSPEKHQQYCDKIKENSPQNLYITGFLEQDQFHLSFRAADLVLLPYTGTEQQGVLNQVNQSGVLNKCASHSVPVAASNQKYFKKLKERYSCVEIFDVNDLEDIKSTVKSILKDAQKRKNLSAAINEYANKNSFSHIANKHSELYHNLVE
ncbi:hypothetical protein [Natronomonas marina]|uniref:hypothetical protein n=1 Tax=Natronomonas marina TaxID=2961939 RepID=UPI0020C9A2CB|nr:hypothetical protein [Natronomonas marina]